MLFSDKDRVWKVGDSIYPSEGISTRRSHDPMSIGAPGFRPPELVERDATFNNKLDIWAIGCMLHELMTRTRLFATDREVIHTPTRDSLLKNKAFNVLPFYLVSLQDWKKTWVEDMIYRTLAVSPDDRPFATDLKGVFNEMMRIGAPSSPKKSDMETEFKFAYMAYRADVEDLEGLDTD